MIISEIIVEGFNTGKPGREPRDYRGRLIKSHIVGPTGSRISDDIKALADRHIKPRKNPDNRGSHYINQYDDDWYVRTGLANNWADFWSKFKNYYRGPTLS